jgi:hypothetical protein
MSRFLKSLVVWGLMLGLAGLFGVGWGEEKKKKPEKEVPPPATSKEAPVPPKPKKEVVPKSTKQPAGTTGDVKKKPGEVQLPPKKPPVDNPKLNPKLIDPKIVIPGNTTPPAGGDVKKGKGSGNAPIIIPNQPKVQTPVVEGKKGTVGSLKPQPGTLNLPKPQSSDPKGQGSVGKPKIVLKPKVGVPAFGGKGTFSPVNPQGKVGLNPQVETPGTPRTGDVKTMKLANSPVKLKPILVPKNGLMLRGNLGTGLVPQTFPQKSDDGKVLQLKPDDTPESSERLDKVKGLIAQDQKAAAERERVIRGLFGASKAKKGSVAEIMPLGLTEEQAAKWRKERGIPDTPDATILPLGTDNDKQKPGAEILALGTDDSKGTAATLLQFSERKQMRLALQKLKGSPELRAELGLQQLNLDKIGGVHQERLANLDNFAHWKNSEVGLKLGLAKQFEFQRQGDLSWRLSLSQNLLSAGGWAQHRHFGILSPTYTTSAFSIWYAGGGPYPMHCWSPHWSPWVDWCWWDVCPVFYDPRPYHCIPIVYDPCLPWVHYHYPVWQPLPFVVCGTWIDVPPVVISSGLDVQLLAVRFVDNGHPEQNKGPRYRIWAINHSPVPIEVPFNVTLLASNDQVPTDALPQAGITVPWMDRGETHVFDIRLPLAANQLGLTPKGQRVPFKYLHVLVDSHQQIPEMFENNNGAVVARRDILPVDPAAFSTDQTAAIPDSLLSIAGEGFGPEPGEVIVSIDGQQVPAEIYGWCDWGIQFAVPNFELVEAMEAEVLVVRGDGAVSNPLTVLFSPEELIETASAEEAPLPEAPLPE